MADTSWKPKRVGESKAPSNENAFVVEVSVRTTDCRNALEKAISEKEGFRLKEGKETDPAALLILELDENPEETFSLIRELSKVSQRTEIFLTASKWDSNILLETMRAGAKEFLAQPIQEKELSGALSRFQERAALGAVKTDEQRKEGKVLAFFGGKGGVGTTSIAVNVAAALKNLPEQPSVVLVDVNQHGGDLPLYLDLQPKHSFRDIAADLSRLDQAFLIRVLTKAESGLQVLPSGYDDLSTGRLNPDCVDATLRILQASFDFIVVDCGHVLDLTTKKALELASFIYVTSTLMVPVVHRTKRILELLRGSGFAPNKLRLVMNRYLSAEKDVLTETEEILKQQSHWLFPNDYPSASQAVNSGKPLIEVAPRSSIAKSYIEFAGSLQDGAGQGPEKSSLMGWLSPFKSRKTKTAVAHT